MSGAHDVTHLEPGTVLMDKYRVVETIGSGGMGVVVAADHLVLETRVAIKFMLPQLVANELVTKRFLNEARAATKIRSDHVARVLDVGTLHAEELPDEGIPFMVMEYLQGRDLAAWIVSGKRFGVEEAIDYVVQAAEALAQAHRVGIIHRDIKPANLFLAEQEETRRIKVLDFGISKLLEEEPVEMGLTKTTTVLGSGLYMSPEQMRSAKNVDYRTDIYSLGVCLYELLSGTQPFTAESFSELCVKVNIDPPTPLRKYRPDISEELAVAIAKAYAREVTDRYQTVQQMVSALQPFAAPGSQNTIERMQGITAAEGRRPSIPPPGSAPLPLGSPALGRTAGPVSATTASARGLERRRPVGVVVTVAVAAVAVAAAAGVFVLRGAGAGPSLGASGGAASPSSSASTAVAAASTSGAASSAADAPDGTTADATADASATGTASTMTTTTSRATPTGWPPRIGTTKPPPSAAATVSPSAAKTAAPTATIDLKCLKPGPNGLMVPCDS